MKHSYKKQIDMIMDSFNFNRVHLVMRALDWHWINADDGVPSEFEIRRYARKLLKQRAKEEQDNCDYKTAACGGFSVSVEDGYLVLSFKIHEVYSQDMFECV